MAKLLHQRKMGWLNDMDCTKRIKGLKLGMRFSTDDHKELGLRLGAALNRHRVKTRKQIVSPSHKTTLHLELVCDMFRKKLREKSRKAKERKTEDQIQVNIDKMATVDECAHLKQSKNEID